MRPTHILSLLIIISYFSCITASHINFSSFVSEIHSYLQNETYASAVRAIIDSAQPYLQPGSNSSVSSQIDSVWTGLDVNDLQSLYNIFVSFFSELGPASSAGTLGGDVQAAYEVFLQAFENAIAPQPHPVTDGTPYQTENYPASIRLALVPGGIVVSWQTLLDYNTTSPVVLYGLSPSALTSTAFGSSHTYGTAYFHDVVINNLAAMTRYYYQIVTHPDLEYSLSDGDIYSFVSYIPAGDPTPYSVTLIGDMGTYNAGNTYDAIINLVNDSALFLHIGDLSYADDFYLRPDVNLLDSYEGSWDSWQEWMVPITSAVPYMTLPGNHEASCQELSPIICRASEKNFTAYRHRFRMPSVESGAGNVSSMWSSFDYGLVHYVLLDTETDFPGANEGSDSAFMGGPFGGPGTGNPALLDWLQSDLEKANNNRDNTPWLIVYGHRPLYTSDADPVQVTSSAIMRATFEQLFLQYNVDLYISGHIHYYERLYPISNFVPQHFSGDVYENPNAPVYIINGAAGNDEGHQPYLLNMSITAVIDATDYGYSRMHVFNATHFLWEFYLAQSQTVADYIWIVKDAPSTSTDLNYPDPDAPYAHDTDLNNGGSTTGGAGSGKITSGLTALTGRFDSGSPAISASVATLLCAFAIVALLV